MYTLTKIMRKRQNNSPILTKYSHSENISGKNLPFSPNVQTNKYTSVYDHKVGEKKIRNFHMIFS